MKCPDYWGLGEYCFPEGAAGPAGGDGWYDCQSCEGTGVDTKGQEQEMECRKCGSKIVEGWYQQAMHCPNPACEDNAKRVAIPYSSGLESPPNERPSRRNRRLFACKKCGEEVGEGEEDHYGHHGYCGGELDPIGEIEGD